MASLKHVSEQQKAYPKPPAGESLSIVQITDTHLFATPGQRMHEVDTGESLNRVLSAIEENESPDLVLVTGDLAQDESREAYQRFAGMLAPLKAPALALAGNHDDLAAMADAFADTAVSLDKLRDVGGWRILQLHTPVAGETWGRLDDDELEWLETALADDSPALICLHHPPLAVGSHWLDTIGLTNAERFFNVIDRYDTVKAVLAGHVHQEMHVRRGTVHFYTTPSTAVQFRPAAARPAFDEIAPGYRRLHLYPHGRIESEVIRVVAEPA